jgi:hypothetical protein
MLTLRTLLLTLRPAHPDLKMNHWVQAPQLHSTQNGALLFVAVCGCVVAYEFVDVFELASSLHLLSELQGPAPPPITARVQRYQARLNRARDNDRVEVVAELRLFADGAPAEHVSWDILIALVESNSSDPAKVAEAKLMYLELTNNYDTDVDCRGGIQRSLAITEPYFQSY